MNFQDVGKILMLCGVFLVFIGLLLVFWQRIPGLGKLPGDIRLHKDGIQLFIPVMTCVVISLVLTIILNIILRIFR